MFWKRASAKFTVFIFIGNIFFSQHSCHSPLLFTSYYYNMLLGQAVAETTGLYGLLIAMLLLFVKPLV